MNKHDIFDMKLYSECLTDIYYLFRCNADSSRSIDVLRSVYPEHYIVRCLKVLRSFVTLMAVRK